MADIATTMAEKIMRNMVKDTETTETSKTPQTIEITETPQTIGTPSEKMDNSLSEVFGTNPMVPSQPQSRPQQTKQIGPPNVIKPSANDIIVAPTTAPVPIQEDILIEADASSARGNLYTLLQQGQDALTYAIDLAKQSDKPSAFEAVSNMIKTLTETNLQLLDIIDKKQKLSRTTTNGKITKEEAAGTSPTQVTNNSIFVGSTAELAKMLENMKGEKQ